MRKNKNNNLNLHLIVRDINKRDEKKRLKIETKLERKMLIKKEKFIKRIKEKIVKQILAKRSSLTFIKPEFLDINIILKEISKDDIFYHIQFDTSNAWFDVSLFTISWKVKEGL
jgi:hypothetical protein